MRFAVYEVKGRRGLAVERNGKCTGMFVDDTGYPGDLDFLIANGVDFATVAEALTAGTAVDLDAVRLLPPLSRPNKIICIGLNYRDHSAETGFEEQTYPTVFARFTSSLIGHLDPIILPPQSSQLDYEGEPVAVIGKPGHHISRNNALDHVAGYSIFNDATLRDYQFRTPQWTMGKNFDGTGAFGPYFVPAQVLPPGCKGLSLETRLNGKAVQGASISDMIFDVETLVTLMREVLTLQTGDIIVTGTPAGVGMARNPPLWMRAGDLCEVEIEGLGALRNSIRNSVIANGET
ncbi:fumarylacetoacetate hydrolase family protein [Paraburkholderia sediminicola]|uniref:fumarylacetoacetate hydrolase family protein n=1 Tax=Paraburkholderia sediminicola TaxID=458836 RepID=UPI0038B7CBD4